LAARSDVTFYVSDTADGRVTVAMTLPTGVVIQGPLQTLRVVGPGLVTPPRSPMTHHDFTAWRESLERSGFAVDLSFPD
jgi:hypothetical protein